MRPGRLRNRVELYTVSTVADGQGGFTSTPVLDSTVWADVQQFRGSQQLEFEQVMEAVGYGITVRNRTDVTTNWLLKFGTRDLKVHTIERNFNDPEYMTIVAYERKND